MNDIENAILSHYDTDATMQMVQYYQRNLQTVDHVARRLARHLENTTRQQVGNAPDDLLDTLALHALLDVNWLAIATVFTEPPASCDLGLEERIYDDDSIEMLYDYYT